MFYLKLEEKQISVSRDANLFELCCTVVWKVESVSDKLG